MSLLTNDAKMPSLRDKLEAKAAEEVKAQEEAAKKVKSKKLGKVKVEPRKVKK